MQHPTCCMGIVEQKHSNTKNKKLKINYFEGSLFEDKNIIAKENAKMATPN
jgi:hypothetical protein